MGECDHLWLWVKDLSGNFDRCQRCFTTRRPSPEGPWVHPPEVYDTLRSTKPNMPPLGCGRGPERGVCDDPDCAPCDEEAERLERAIGATDA